MLADPERIQVFQWDGKQLSGPISSLSTPEVLSAYEPDFSRKRIFEFYLVRLLEAWLRDAAYHWKSDSPPGSAELRKVGLLERVEGGTRVAEPEVQRGHLLHCLN
jgi:hypothetical protein